MTMTDPIADMIARIKNGYMASKKEVRVGYSKIKYNLAKLLAENGYLQKVETDVEDNKRELIIKLKYEQGEAVLTNIKRVSKPGLRLYVRKKTTPKVLRGLGIIIISTPKGLMTDKEAQEKGIGGELVCEVW